MPSDNVFPIARRRRHPETVPPAEAGQRRFRWFVAGLGVVWAGVLAAGIAFTPFPAIWPLLALSALVIAAEHRFILFGDETSMSSSIVVILCSVTFWHDDAYLVGPMLVATCGGLLFQHLRSHSWALIFANGSTFSLSAAGAAFAIRCLPSPKGPSAVVAASAAVICYWVLNSTSTGFLAGIRNQSKVIDSVLTQLLSQIALSPIAVSAAIIGLIAAAQTPFHLILVAPPLVILELSSTPRDGSRRLTSVAIGASAVILTGVLSASIARPSLLLFALALAAMPIIANTVGWQSLTVATSFAVCIGLIHGFLGASVASFMVCAVLTTLCASILRFTPHARRVLMRRPRLDGWVIIGLLAPHRPDASVGLVSASLGLTLEVASDSTFVGLIGACVVLSCSLVLNRSMRHLETPDSPSGLFR